jgi:hypothetical protein
MGHFIAALVGRLFADEFKAWMPWITERLTRAAVRKLPREQRQRYSEEWRGYLNDVPGEFAKVWVASGFFRAARKLSGERWAVLPRIGAFALMAFLLPIFVVITILIRINSGGHRSIFPRRYVFDDGRVFWLSRFQVPRPVPLELLLREAFRAGLTPPP